MKGEKTVKKIRVLFVCHGNICRSTMAEFIMKKMVYDKGISDYFYIESAGSNVFEPGSLMYPEAKACLRKHDNNWKEMDLKRSRNVVKSDYKDFDYILYAEDDNKRGILRVIGEDPDEKILPIMHFSKDKSHIDNDIDDPWYSRDFEKSYSDLIEGISGFIDYCKIK